MTDDLKDLLGQLNIAAAPEAAELIDRTLTPEIMENFKLAVDSMRYLLWLYIQAASCATSGNISDPTHGLRMQRATEIVRGLREDGIQGFQIPQQAPHFFEQMEALVNYYSQTQNQEQQALVAC